MAFDSDHAYNVNYGAYQGRGHFDYQGSIASVDTHDGGEDAKRRRIEDVPGFDEPRKEREAKEKLRDMLARAVDPQAFIAPPAEAIELAAPYVERLESGAPRIDWKRLERENVIRAQLYAYAAEYERKVREFEADEEDVSILLWH